MKLSRPSILAINLEPTIGQPLRKNLRLQGFPLLLANTSDALTILENKIYDVILLDLGIPKISRLKILDAIAALAGSSPYIYLITGQADRQVKKELSGLLRCGLNFEIMHKPVRVEFLETLVQHIAQSGKGEVEAP